jgi:hypothetical protein
MPERLDNARHELFCHELAKGLSQAAAHRKVFRSRGLTSEQSGSRLANTVKVKSRVREIREAFRKREERKTHLTMDEKRGYCAKKVRDPNTKVSDALKAIELDSKINGDLVEKVEHGGSIQQTGVLEISLPAFMLRPRPVKRNDTPPR